MKFNNIPVHIGVILDGNRRFAKELMKRPWDGHKIGLKKARDVLEWACETGIKHVTAYTLSFENLSTRPKLELKMILKYLGMECDAILKKSEHIVHKFGVKVKFIGRLQLLPDALRAKMKKVEDKTFSNSTHFLNIAVAYGGQQEIVDAVKDMMKEVLGGELRPADLNEDIIKKHLYTNGQPFPDMIIRTGGEKRLSNFLPFQSAYSELFFLDVRWPELSREDFDNAIKEFGERQRRFGS